MPDDPAWLTFRLERAGTGGSLTHGTMSTPVRNIRKDGEALVFEAMVDVAWEELLARLYARVRG